MKYKLKKGTVTITDCDPKPTGDLIIPDTIDGFPVTKIGRYAFTECAGLTSVTIPNGVTSISNLAFNECSELTSVTLPSSITKIGINAFWVCSGLTSITVDIANSTYSSNDGILFNKAQTSLITFPAGKIGAYTIPNSVTKIVGGAFYECRGLTNITIPNSVTSIGEGALEECSELTSVTLPSGVKYIGDYAFSGCSKLTSAIIPSSFTKIGTHAFPDHIAVTKQTL